MQIVGDVLYRRSIKKAVAARAKNAGKEFFAGTFNDLTQQQGSGGRKRYKRKRKAIPVSSTQNKRRRTSPALFKTIFD